MKPTISSNARNAAASERVKPAQVYKTSVKRKNHVLSNIKLSDSSSDDLTTVKTNECKSLKVFSNPAKKNNDESEDISNDEKTTKPTLQQTLEFRGMSARSDSTHSLSKRSHHSKKSSVRLSIGKGSKDK